jgi:predicted membrane-bound spermidine synthase
MRLVALYSTSILAGFCMMALEIMGGRLLQPVFGSSIDVWAAIITVFILSLSIGYVVGGRVADKARSNAALGWILAAAGACYLILPAIALPFMEALPNSLTHARWGVLVAALVLFLPPSLLLGAVSPILVKLVFVDADRVGRTTGTLYAIGSFGNVIGILISNYVLLEYVDLNHNILAQGIVLAILGVLHLAKKIPASGHLVEQEVPPAVVAGVNA